MITRLSIRQPAIHLLVCAAFLLSASSSWTVPNRPDALPLPDTLVFRDDAELPSFAIGKRRVPCAILEESADTLTVTTARFKGIRERHQVAKAILEKIERGVAGDREYAEIYDLLEPPENSQSEEFYQAIIDEKLKPFVTQFPDHPQAPLVRATLEVFATERKQIQAGHIKVLGEWMDASDYQRALPDLQAKRWLEEQRSHFDVGRIRAFTEHLNGLDSHRDSRLFPDLVEATNEWLPIMIARLKPDAMQQELETHLASLRTQLTMIAASVGAIYSRKPRFYLSPSANDQLNFYNPRTRLWHRLDEAYFDESSGDLSHIPSASESQRIANFEAESNDLQARISDVQDQLTRVPEVVAAQRAALNKHADALALIDVATLRRVGARGREIVAELADGRAIPDEALSVSAMKAALDKWSASVESALSEVKALHQAWPENPFCRALHIAAPQITTHFRTIQRRDWQQITSAAAGHFEQPTETPTESMSENSLSEPLLHSARQAMTARGRRLEQIIAPVVTSKDQPAPTVHPLTSAWLTQRMADWKKIEAALGRSLGECEQCLASGDTAGFIARGTEILSFNPNGPAATTLTAMATAHLTKLLEAGKVSEGRGFVKAATALPISADLRSDWDREFHWTNLWGHRRKFYTGSHAFAIAITVVGLAFLSGVILSVYLVFRKWLIRRVFKRRW